MSGKGRAISIKLFNTLTKTKETFKPIQANQVGIYCCGPTVYKSPHIGNLRTYLTTDLLNRTLLSNGLKVDLVVNITDVGHLVGDGDEGVDKMIVGAKDEKLTSWDIAKKYELEFLDNLQVLNILKPNHLPKATNHIAEMIALIEQIIGNGFGYKTDDGIYFDTSLDPNYGDLAGLDLEGQRSGDREITITQKRNSADFALWKFAPKDKNREMIWDSPWGSGFPGWHIECSAMSQKYLGIPFDIHLGGIDHIPVHHTNEIAQTKAATGHIIAKTFLHNEFVIIDSQKMSKSKNNFYTLNDLLVRGYPAAAFRHLILSASYHEKINFTWESLDASYKALKRIKKLIDTSQGKEDQTAWGKAIEIMNDDLSSPRLLAFLEEHNNPWLWLRTEALHGLNFSEIVDQKMELTAKQKDLLVQREVYRQNRQYDLADQIRQDLEKQGVKVEDRS